MITSAKASFSVGADITEFLQLFTDPEMQLLGKVHQAIDLLSDSW